jgi:hypothetical protein
MCTNKKGPKEKKWRPQRDSYSLLQRTLDYLGWFGSVFPGQSIKVKENIQMLQICKFFTESSLTDGNYSYSIEKLL